MSTEIQATAFQLAPPSKQSIASPTISAQPVPQGVKSAPQRTLIHVRNVMLGI